MEPEQKKQRITNLTAVMMIFVAVLFDLVSFIPLIGTVVGTLTGGAVFVLWFLILGIPLISPKKLISMLGNSVGEVITAAWWPGITVGVIVMIVITRTEDKFGVSLLDKVSGKGVGRNLSLKETRRAQNPIRTAQVRARLERMRQTKQGGGLENVVAQKERPQIKDINYPKAA